MMENEKRRDLIDRQALGIGRCDPDAFPLQNRGYCAGWNGVIGLIEQAPTVDAVEVKQYETLLEMYNELRENFIDYVCSGIPNVAPYCLNKCEECVDKWGWCKQYSDHCKGFNPAEYIPDGERKDNGES